MSEIIEDNDATVPFFDDEEVVQLNYREKIPDNLYSFYQQQTLCDVTLVSGLNNQK